MVEIALTTGILEEIMTEASGNTSVSVKANFITASLHTIMLTLLNF